MIPKFAIGALVLLLGSNSLCAQHKRTFADDFCSYTLPGDEWNWMKPEVIKGLRYLAQAMHPDGVGFQIGCERLKPGETPTLQSYLNFEATLMKTGPFTKVKGGAITLKGLAAYQFEAKNDDSRVVSRLIYANERLYILNIVDAFGRPISQDEVDRIYEGFAFTKDPEPVIKSKEDLDAEREHNEGRAMFALVIVVIVLGGAVGIMIHRKISK
jgi:hypothetical protein